MQVPARLDTLVEGAQLHLLRRPSTCLSVNFYFISCLLFFVQNTDLNLFKLLPGLWFCLCGIPLPLVGFGSPLTSLRVLL